MKTIVYTHQAAKDFDALEPVARKAIGEALDLYAREARGDVKRLAGRDGFRLRVGRYRVLFTEDATMILVVYVGKRETTTYGRQ